MIGDSNFHAKWRLVKESRTSYSNPPVDKSLWTGKNAVGLEDLYVGDGFIIGYGSVVKEEPPNNCIVVGNPARVWSLESGDSPLEF